MHLGGRTAATLDCVAADIRAAGGRAENAVVDTLDEQAGTMTGSEVNMSCGAILD